MMASPGQAQRPAEIPYELERLDKAIAEVENLFQELATRLQPISNPQPYVSDKIKPESPICELAVKIRVCSDRLGNLSESMSSLKYSLEI